MIILTNTGGGRLLYFYTSIFLRNLHKESLNKNLTASASDVHCLTCPVPIAKKMTPVPQPQPELPNIKVNKIKLSSLSLFIRNSVFSFIDGSVYFV